MNTDKIREDEIKNVSKDLMTKCDLDKIVQLIKDNKAEFSHKEKEYRVRLLNNKDKTELDFFRRKKFGELLQDKNILFEKEIIKLYKERGIDIDEIDENIKKLQAQLKDSMYKLGESIEKKEPESIWKKYREDQNEIISEISELVLQKSKLLENSFQNLLRDYVNEVMTYLSLEVKIENTYIRAFETFDKFLESDDELQGLAIVYTLALNNLI